MGIIAVLTLFCVLFAFEEVTPVTLLDEAPTPNTLSETPMHVTMARCSIVIGGLAFVVRAGLHRLDDQDQARLYFGRAMVALEATRQFTGFKNAAPGNATQISFMMGRLMVFLYHAFAACAPCAYTNYRTR